MKQKAVVFGGAGFIGRHVTAKLLASGLEVWVCDSLITGSPLAPHAELHFLPLDILDKVSLANMLPSRVDFVYHLAFPTSKCNRERETQFLALATEGMLNVLDYCVKADAFLMYGSSISVYGLAQTDRIHEGQPLRPLLLYGANKCLAEHYMAVYAQTKALRYCIFRISDVFGPHDLRRNAVNLFIDASLNGSPIEIKGNGAQLRTFTYVEDIAEGLSKARNIQKGEGIFNLGGGQAISVLELAEQIMQRTGNQVPLVFQPEGQDNRNYIIDSSRFLAEVGPFEHIGIFQGLEKTIHHRRNA